MRGGRDCALQGFRLVMARDTWSGAKLEGGGFMYYSFGGYVAMMFISSSIFAFLMD
jgi:hypothetical protein